MLLDIRKYTNIIWDWNGTLLNDVSICIKSINILLKHRNLELLTETKYREVFTFPVRKYYEHIGFDFSAEDFTIPAHEFITNYNNYFTEAKLFTDAVEVLDYFSKNNYRQFILSAMEQDSLVKSVKDRDIIDYFDTIIGIDNHFATSKIDSGYKLIETMKLDKSKTVMIGDTLHDVEVADAMSIDCILVSRGHQSYDVLKTNGNIVKTSLIDIIACRIM